MRKKSQLQRKKKTSILRDSHTEKWETETQEECQQAREKNAISFIVIGYARQKKKSADSLKTNIENEKKLIVSNTHTNSWNVSISVCSSLWLNIENTRA